MQYVVFTSSHVVDIFLKKGNVWKVNKLNQLGAEESEWEPITTDFVDARDWKDG